MAFTQRIESLKKQHANIDHKLHQELIRPSSDDGTLCHLKRLKLNLKDEIARLESTQQIESSQQAA
jgi:hypothetical protein